MRPKKKLVFLQGISIMNQPAGEERKEGEEEDLKEGEIIWENCMPFSSRPRNSTQWFKRKVAILFGSTCPYSPPKKIGNFQIKWKRNTLCRHLVPIPISLLFFLLNHTSFNNGVKLESSVSHT